MKERKKECLCACVRSFFVCHLYLVLWVACDLVSLQFYSELKHTCPLRVYVCICACARVWCQLHYEYCVNRFLNELCEGYEDSVRALSDWLKIHDVFIVVAIVVVVVAVVAVGLAWIDRLTVWPFLPPIQPRTLCQLSGEHTLRSMCERFSLNSSNIGQPNQWRKESSFLSLAPHIPNHISSFFLLLLLLVNIFYSSKSFI